MQTFAGLWNGCYFHCRNDLFRKVPKKFISGFSIPISNLILFQFSRNSKRFLRTSKNLDLAEINRINFEANKLSNLVR